MWTIALVASKGGAGKSTLAASLAVAAQEAGLKTYVIDMDPQRSLVAWDERRQADEPAVDRIEPAKLGAALQGLAGAGYSLAVIDTAGIDDGAALSVMQLADLTLVPARPSTLDIEAARPTIAALTRFSRPYAFVLNACPPGRSYRLEDAGRALGLLGVLALPPIVHRADHVDAMGLGLGVTEHAPAGKAAEEIRALWRWIAGKIGIHHDQETAVPDSARRSGTQ
jgi:chromosome partitioning protein